MSKNKTLINQPQRKESTLKRGQKANLGGRTKNLDRNLRELLPKYPRNQSKETKSFLKNRKEKIEGGSNNRSSKNKELRKLKKEKKKFK